MEEEKKKRKNKKKKNKHTKGIENVVGVEQSVSSNQNHAVETRDADDTSGVDEDPSRHATFEEKIKQLLKDKEAHKQREAILEEKLRQLAQEKDASLLKEASFEEKFTQSQKEISSLMRQEASQEEKIGQLQMEKDAYKQKEAELEMRIFQLQSENNSCLQKENGFEERINELVDEAETFNAKKVVFEDRISQLVDEVENLNCVKVSLEEKLKEAEKERDNWFQKEKSFREIISSLSGDNALLEARVKELEELRTTIVQENQLLQQNIHTLQTQLHNPEKSAALPNSPPGSKTNALEVGDPNSELVATRALVDKLVNENTELVEKVNMLYVELERRCSTMEVSSSLGSDIITRSPEVARGINGLTSGLEMKLGAVEERDVEPQSKSNDRVLQSSKSRDDGNAAKTDSSVVNSSEIEPDEIVQIPLDENKVQSAADLETGSVDQNDEEIPLTNAPLIGAPFRLISFFARYVSGADLVNKNSAT